MRKKPRKMRSIPLREELMLLTGDVKDALLLQQLIYWTEITGKMDEKILKRMDALEKVGASFEDIDEESKKLRDGWFYKSLEDLKEELFDMMSISTVSRRLSALKKKGFIEDKKDPHDKLNHEKWYRANLYQIQLELHKLGFNLHGYAPIQEEEPEVVPEVPDIEPEPVEEEEPQPEFSMYNWVNQQKKAQGEG